MGYVTIASPAKKANSCPNLERARCPPSQSQIPRKPRECQAAHEHHFMRNRNNAYLAKFEIGGIALLQVLDLVEFAF